MLTNYQFLERVFGADVEEGFCCAFPGDPTTAKYPYIPAHKANHPALNTFFAVSTFSEDPTTGKPRRSPEFFKGLYCLVVDDVGTKLDSRAVRGKLGDPTWRIETSPICLPRRLQTLIKPIAANLPRCRFSSVLKRR